MRKRHLKKIQKVKNNTILATVDFIASSTREQIKKIGWKCDEDMDAVTYAEIVENRLKCLIKIASR